MPRLLAGLLVLSPLAGAFVVGLALWLPPRWVSRSQDVATILTSTASLGLAIAIATMIVERGTALPPFPVAGLTFYLDALSIYFVLLVNVIALAASFYADPYLTRRGRTGRYETTRFYVLFNLFHFTMVLVPMVANLVLLWIAVELTTLFSTFLVGSDRTRKALEAAWKYIVITSTGIIFALLGTIFLASAIPPDPPFGASISWPDLVAHADDLDPGLVRLSFLFVLIGYGTKAGFAPMHTWLPDGHGEAPYPVSALLSGVLLKSALYAILRFYTVTNLALGGSVFTSRMLLGCGLLSLLVATPFILKRNPFKRVLAYHSLEHMGIITFGIGIGGPIALFGALLHALNHGITKSLMFLAYGNVQDNHPARHDAQASDPGGAQDEPHRGVLQAMPWTGFVLAVGGLALVGSPPFNIFYSEFVILWGGVNTVWGHAQKAAIAPKFWLVAALALFLISVTLIFAGLVRHLGRILVGNPLGRFRRETFRQVAPLLVLLLLVVVFGFTVPTVGPLDLHRLLSESVNVVCGAVGCR